MEKNASAHTQEKTELDALRRYLLNALDAYKQGNPAQLNQIFQKISSEEIEVSFLKSWLNTFSRILVETLSQSGIDCSIIIDFVLHKSKMFYSTSKHLQAFDSYQKFCLSLISVKNSYLPVIMKLLIQNLVPREMYEEETCSQNFKVIIGNNCFKNLADLKSYVTAIIKNPKYELSSVQHSVELEPEHTKFMYELFSYHPKAQEKLKGLTKIFIGYNTFGPRPTKCFLIEKEAFLREDISYLKACSSAYDTFAEQNLDNLLNPGQATLTEGILTFLVKLLKLYPLSVSQLPSLLRDLYPHRRLDENIQRIFLINILKLALKFERVRDIVVNVCLESLIQIDVEIKGAADGSIKDSVSLEMAKKLDWLLLIFFDYFDYCFAIRARKEKNCFGEIPKRPLQQDAEAFKENKEKMLDIFTSFLNLFQNNLLMTYQSKYVQFIFFYLCSYTEIYPEFIGMFLTRLVNNMEDIEMTKFVRMNSVNYLRSMIIRANFIPARTVNKAIEILNNFIKKYDRIVRKRAKKQAAEGSNYDDVFHFEKIELNASSNYRDRLAKGSYKEQESEYNQLFQKFNIYYYAVYAEMLMFIHKVDILVANNRREEFRAFSNLLIKTHNRYKTFKFFSKNILAQFKQVLAKFNDCEELERLLAEELESIEEEEKNDKIRGDVFIDDYQPFGPNFLNRSKKVLVQNYNYIGNEEESQTQGTEIVNPNEEPTKNTRLIYDTLDDEVLSDMSSMSKHDTDTSNDQLKKAGTTSGMGMGKVPLAKRRQEPLLEGLDTEKKFKPTDYLTKQKIGTGV